MIAIIDLETSGFSITKNAICEIGVVIADLEYNTLEAINWIIKPYLRPDSDELCSYKEDAMQIHGISMEEIEKGHNITEVLIKLSELFRDHNVTTLAGHNLKCFDLPRLNHVFERFSNVGLNHLEIIDTLEFSRNRLKIKSHKLCDLCTYFGIVHNDSHRALGDCYGTLEVLKRLDKPNR